MASKIRVNNKLVDLFARFQDFEMITQYLGVKEKISILHKTCNSMFEAIPGIIIRNNQIFCKHCAEKSDGELLVRKILNYYKENYKEEVSFPGLKHLGSLRFDFIVYDNENNIKYAIEFDGEHHFKPINFSGNEVQAKVNFEQQKMRDKLKNEFCIKERIKLIRIRFDEKEKLKFLLRYIILNNKKLLCVNSLEFFEVALSKVFYCSIPIEVLSKSNSVMSSKKGFTYIPKKFKDFDHAVIVCIRSAMNNSGFKKMLGSVIFHMNNYHGTTRIKDVTNSFKSVCDALNDLLYVDDNQIVECSANKYYDKFNPRTEILALEIFDNHELLKKLEKNQNGPSKRRKQSKKKQKEKME